MALATAPSAKGPLAKLRPAEMEGSVSELELEPGTAKKAAKGKRAPRKSGPKLDKNKTATSAAATSAAATGAKASQLNDDPMTGSQVATARAAPASESGVNNWPPASSNIFAPVQPMLYPARAYYPPRNHAAQTQHPMDLKSLTSAADIASAEAQNSDASSLNRASSPTGFDKASENTSPATALNTIASTGGDAASDATSLSPDRSMSFLDLDPRLFPPGWKPPYFDLMDPDVLMTTMRDRTVWTFWDCYLPLGCRDQDMVMLSNDGVAFPCAAWVRATALTSDQVSANH